MRNNKKIAELFGWYGAAAILLAYALASFKTISIDGYIYQLLNLTGALGLVGISLIKKARQPAALNIVWAIIALATIISLLVRGYYP